MEERRFHYFLLATGTALCLIAFVVFFRQQLGASPSETGNGFSSSSSGAFRDLSLFIAAPMAPSASATLCQSEISSKIPQNLSDLQISVNSLLAQYTYQGPNQPVPGNPQLIRVEVLVRDSPKAGGVQVQSAEFNGQGIPLKPRDIYGNRGTSSFQLSPGQYKLAWVVQRDKSSWPRLVTHEEMVTIDPRDLWLQISIEGEEASIR